MNLQIFRFKLFLTLSDLFKLGELFIVQRFVKFYICLTIILQS